jgi:signal transduction histidine kinase
MEGKDFSQKYGKIIEASTWIVIILVVFGVHLLPVKLLSTSQVYLLIGGIVALALLYYLVMYKYFSRTRRLYLKEIADIVLIGILIALLKDYGQYFFALYFLPIAAAALELEFINALIIATIAALFVIFEIILGSYNLLPKTTDVFVGIWQIAIILFITIFCRFLAIQIKQEKSLKDEALARQKALEEESKKEKEFMSLTSHQLYTPLSMIRGFSGMLNDGTFGKLSTKQKEAADQIYANSKRMVALITELLSISRIESGKIKLNYANFAPQKLLENIIFNFNQTKENKKVKISAKISENVTEIEADADKIRQVIYNLLDNALKYTPEGEITVSINQDRKNTIFSIQDSGIGIKKEDYDKIFEPFYRGKNILELDNKGTGLGLYIARLIVQKHGGKIWFASKEKQGTTFSFSIPNKNNGYIDIQ